MTPQAGEHRAGAGRKAGKGSVDFVNGFTIRRVDIST
jgi:hypothetical protein